MKESTRNIIFYVGSAAIVAFLTMQIARPGDVPAPEKPEHQFTVQTDTDLIPAPAPAKVQDAPADSGAARDASGNAGAQAPAAPEPVQAARSVMQEGVVEMTREVEAMEHSVAAASQKGMEGQAMKDAGQPVPPQKAEGCAEAKHEPCTDTHAAATNELRFSLANGLNVYILRDTRFPIVCSRLFVRTGSVNETPAEYGISHVLEHMVFKGTESRPKGAVAREVEHLGGYLNAYTSFDKTCYITDMPSRHWKTGIDIVRDMAFHPTLDAAELESEKPVIISELEGDEDNPRRHLHEMEFSSTLSGTPYEHPIIGTRDSIRAVTRESLQAYIARRYDPRNMLLVVAGDVNPDEVRAFVEKGFGGYKNTTVLDSAPVMVTPKESKDGRVTVVRKKLNKVYLGISFPAPSLRDITSNDLDMLCYLLDGDANALFNRRYRDTRIVDSIDVSNASLYSAGVFSVNAVLDADHVPAFFASIVKDLATLKTAQFSDKELERARLNQLDSLTRVGETLNGLASWRATVEFDLNGRQGEANIRDKVSTVGFPEIAATYARWAKPENVHVTVIAPEGAQLPDFEAVLKKEWPSASGTDATAAQACTKQESIDLGSGRKLLLLPDTNVPYFSVDMMFSGGRALVAPSDQGLASLSAALLPDGCGDMDRKSFDSFLASRASSIQASAGLQSFHCLATGPSSSMADVLGRMKTMLESPLFDETELKREAGDLKAAIAARMDKPMGRLSAKMPAFLFGATHPYGYDSLGTPENLDRFTRADVTAFWDKQRRQPWTIAVSGTFTREQILAWAKSLPEPADPRVQASAPEWGKDHVLDVKMDKANQAHLMLIFPTEKATGSDVPALKLLQNVLAGQSGLLFSQLRDVEGLGYTVTAVNRFYPEAGFMLFYIGTTPDKVDRARDGFARIIEALKTKPLPKILLEAGVNAMEGDWVRGAQSLGARCREATYEAAMNEAPGWEKRQIAEAAKVTPEDLQRLAQKYLNNAYELKLIP